LADLRFVAIVSWRRGCQKKKASEVKGVVRACKDVSLLPDLARMPANPSSDFVCAPEAASTEKKRNGEALDESI
jgi:hypothetical protein